MYEDRNEMKLGDGGATDGDLVAEVPPIQSVTYLLYAFFITTQDTFHKFQAKGSL